MKREGASEWVKFDEFEHPASRVKAADLVTDRQGQNSASSGWTGRTGMTTAPQTNPIVVEEQRFANAVAKMLNDAHAQNAFEQLVIIAAPEFLGRVRGALTDRVQQSLYATVNKDYSAFDENELAERVMLP